MVSNDDLMNFGFATAAAAAQPGARTLGAMGQGGLAMMQGRQQQAQTQQIQLQNALVMPQLEFMKYRLNALKQDDAESAPSTSPVSPGATSIMSPTATNPGEPFQTRTIPNNNPGNLRPVGATSGFQSFPSVDAGVTAMQEDLLGKVNGTSQVMQGKFGKDYKPTLRNILSVYAPSTENDTTSYIKNVSLGSGIDPDKTLTPGDVAKIIPLMIKQEGNGSALNQSGLIQNTQITPLSSVQEIPSVLPQNSSNIQNLQARIEAMSKKLKHWELAGLPTKSLEENLKAAQDQLKDALKIQQEVEAAGPKKIAEENATNKAAAVKSVAAMGARIDNAKNILKDQIALAPKTYSGSLGQHVLEPMAENAANFNLTSGYDSDKLNAQAVYENNSANLFTQALPAIIPPGSRMDIPFVQAVKQAENSDPYAAPSAKIAVNKNLMKMLDFLQENITNNSDLLDELTNPEGTPISPAMMKTITKYNKQFSSEQATHPMDGTIAKNAKGETIILQGGQWIPQ